MLSGTVAGGLAMLLAIVVFRNMADGTMGDWLAAKFLNRTTEAVPAGVGAALTLPGTSLTPERTTVPVPLGAGSSGSLSDLEIATLARAAGIPPGEPTAIAVAIALAESGGDPSARSGTSDVGLWQVNLPSWAHLFSEAELLTATGSARAMAHISAGGTRWSPWVTFWTTSPTHSYRRYLPRGRDAADQIR